MAGKGVDGNGRCALLLKEWELEKEEVAARFVFKPRVELAPASNLQSNLTY